MLAIKFVPGIYYSGTWWGMLVVGLLFGMINTFIRPFIKLFTLPLLILSLGLFTFIINALMLMLTSWFSLQFQLGFSVEGFRAAFWGSLLISVVSMIISCLMPSKDD